MLFDGQIMKKIFTTLTIMAAVMLTSSCQKESPDVINNVEVDQDNKDNKHNQDKQDNQGNQNDQPDQPNQDNQDNNPVVIPSTDRTFTVGGVQFKMIAVEGGTFTMGATSEQGNDAYDWEKPAHAVTLSGYSIGETEVTQALWLAVMGSNPSYFSGNQKPVEEVSWNDCQNFIKKLNELTGEHFRLPTEAEWEFAARGGIKSQGYKYAGSNSADEVAADHNSDVATKKANELGLYDMSGSVLEWCNDWYDDYSSSSQTNPTGPNSGEKRVLRGAQGGGEGLLTENCFRVSYRLSAAPDDKHWPYDDDPVYLGRYGFRLAL